MSENQVESSTPVAPEAAPENVAPSIESALASPPAPEQEVAPAPEAAPEAAPEPSTIEAVSDAVLDDPIFKSEEDYKGINYQQVVGELPDDAKKLVHNLRSSFTRKTQELASQRKELEEARAALDAQRAALIESDFYKDVSDKASQEVGELDPYSTASLEARIQQEVAQRMKDMLEPIRQQNELQQRQMRLNQFKAEHPDLESMKNEVADVLQQNEHLSLEQAYWQVKGRQLAQEQKRQTEELAKYKSAAKAAGLKVGGASRGRTTGVPQYVLDKDDPVAVYRYLEANKGR